MFSFVSDTAITPELYLGTVVLTVAICHIFLYGFALKLWLQSGLKTGRPGFWSFSVLWREYIAAVCRFQRKEKLYSLKGSWAKDSLGVEGSPLATIHKVEKCLDVERLKGYRQSGIQMQVLAEMHKRATDLFNTKSARSRLMADQKATTEALANGGLPVKVVASTKHPISRAISTAAPAPVAVVKTVDWAKVLGLVEEKKNGTVTANGLRDAYKRKKSKAKSNHKQLQSLQLAINQARKELGIIE